MAEEVRGIDANVVLRYLLDDVPAQAERARRLIDSDTPLGLTAVALAEVAWTLTGPQQQLDRRWAARELSRLLTRENLVPIGFDRTEMQRALELCAAESGAPNFGDAFIAAICRSQGVQEIYSFDTRFARAGLTPVLPP